MVQVPPFVNEGELLRIDTRTGEYVERVKGVARDRIASTVNSEKGFNLSEPMTEWDASSDISP